MMPKHDHTAILQTVRQELPPEELICDLSDLFKVFGDSTRIRIYRKRRTASADWEKSPKYKAIRVSNAPIIPKDTALM